VLAGSLCWQKNKNARVIYKPFNHRAFLDFQFRQLSLLHFTRLSSIFRGFFAGILQKSKTLAISQLLVAEKCQNIFASNSFAFPYFVFFFCNFFLLSILFSLALNQRMCASWLRARGWGTRGKDI